MRCSVSLPSNCSLRAAADAAATVAARTKNCIMTANGERKDCRGRKEENEEDEEKCKNISKREEESFIWRRGF